MNYVQRFCIYCAQFNRLPIRTYRTKTPTPKGYKQWPHEKVRRIGRRPTEYRGQGGNKSRIAYDKRYPLSGKDINESTEGLKRGGNEMMNQMIGEDRAKHNLAVLKYYDYVKEKEVTEMVPEMIPEFVVPDLSDFQLRPYVSYKVNVGSTPPKHSADQLFKETYLEDKSEVD